MPPTFKKGAAWLKMSIRTPLHNNPTPSWVFHYKNYCCLMCFILILYCSNVAAQILPLNFNWFTACLSLNWACSYPNQLLIFSRYFTNGTISKSTAFFRAYPKVNLLQIYKFSNYTLSHYLLEAIKSLFQFWALNW